MYALLRTFDKLFREMFERGFTHWTEKYDIGTEAYGVLVKK